MDGAYHIGFDHCQRCCLDHSIRSGAVCTPRRRWLLSLVGGCCSPRPLRQLYVRASLRFLLTDRFEMFARIIVTGLILDPEVSLRTFLYGPGGVLARVSRRLTRAQSTQVEQTRKSPLDPLGVPIAWIDPLRSLHPRRNRRCLPKPLFSRL